MSKPRFFRQTFFQRIPFVIFFQALSAIFFFALIGCDKPEPVINTDGGRSERAIALIKEMGQTKGQEQEYSKTIDGLMGIVKEEIQKNPSAYYTFFDEILPIAIKSSPGFALQFENFASDALRGEIQRIKQDANVTKLAVLEKQLAIANEELIKLRRLETALARKMPVFLEGWADAPAYFKITNSVTSEVKNFAISGGGKTNGRVIIYLSPGEYSAVTQFNGSDVKIDFTVLTEPAIKASDGNCYHAVVKAPGYAIER